MVTRAPELEHRLKRIEDKTGEVVIIGVGDDLDLVVRQLKQLASRVREALHVAMAIKAEEAKYASQDGRISTPTS